MKIDISPGVARQLLVALAAEKDAGLDRLRKEIKRRLADVAPLPILTADELREVIGLFNRGLTAAVPLSDPKQASRISSASQKLAALYERQRRKEVLDADARQRASETKPSNSTNPTATRG